jgi:hypothetical protein
VLVVSQSYLYSLLPSTNQSQTSPHSHKPPPRFIFGTASVACPRRSLSRLTSRSQCLHCSFLVKCGSIEYFQHSHLSAGVHSRRSLHLYPSSSPCIKAKANTLPDTRIRLFPRKWLYSSLQSSRRTHRFTAISLTMPFPGLCSDLGCPTPRVHAFFTARVSAKSTRGTIIASFNSHGPPSLASSTRMPTTVIFRRCGNNLECKCLAVCEDYGILQPSYLESSTRSDAQINTHPSVVVLTYQLA